MNERSSSGIQLCMCISLFLTQKLLISDTAVTEQEKHTGHVQPVQCLKKSTHSLNAGGAPGLHPIVFVSYSLHRILFSVVGAPITKNR